MDSALELQQLSDINVMPRCFKRHSGFGVVLDTTRAMPVSGTAGAEVQVHIKLIDPSANPQVERNQRYINIFAFQSANSQYPFVLRIGDIFRFINFEFSDFKNQPRGKNRPGASWRLFNGAIQADLTAYSSSQEAVEQNTEYIKEKINSLKRWAHELFAANSCNIIIRIALTFGH